MIPTPTRAAHRRTAPHHAADFDDLPSPTCGKVLAIMELLATHPDGITAAAAARLSGITANLVSPGPIRSDAWDEEQKAHVGGMVSRVPVGRLGEPDEVAATVSLLASEKGAFINGQILQVNGGAET